jgi:hypothetical protein
MSGNDDFSMLHVQLNNCFISQKKYLTYADKSSDMQCLWSCLVETGTYIVDKSNSGSPEDTWCHIDLSAGPTLHQTWYLKINEITGFNTSVMKYKFSIIFSL